MWDANLANWPRVLKKAIHLKPRFVLPGHGEAGGTEILAGQRQFLLDMYAAVKQQVRQGKKLDEIKVELPAVDQNWIPKDLSGFIEANYREITEGKPMGALNHVWK